MYKAMMMLHESEETDAPEAAMEEQERAARAVLAEHKSGHKSGRGHDVHRRESQPDSQEASA